MDRQEPSEAEIISRLTTVKQYEQTERKRRAYIVVAIMLVIVLFILVGVAYILADNAQPTILPEPTMSPIEMMNQE